MSGSAASHLSNLSSPSSSHVGPISEHEKAAMRKQIISIGKQPKAQSRRKKDMVSELFDSLTPAAEYFSEKTRRRRAAPKTYREDEYVKVMITVLATYLSLTVTVQFLLFLICSFKKRKM